MRKSIVAGNWKMNKTLDEGVALAKEINGKVTDNGVTVIVCPPFIHLTEVNKVLTSGLVGLSAQNCADHDSGAYTGEVSPAMIKSTGAEYVIVGHSERRSYYGDTNEILKSKVELALASGLTPIFCCGEVLEEREAGNHFEVVKSQIKEALFSLSADDMKKIIVAYEPVWAIGTGKTATPDQAQEMHKEIREFLGEKYGTALADELSILYGGSCKPSNAKELFGNPDVDGGLIGGASLKADDFIGIIEAF
jgi:triosephosphate isomerase (TIM)